MDKGALFKEGSKEANIDRYNDPGNEGKQNGMTGKIING